MGGPTHFCVLIDPKAAAADVLHAARTATTTLRAFGVDLCLRPPRAARGLRWPIFLPGELGHPHEPGVGERPDAAAIAAWVDCYNAALAEYQARTEGGPGARPRACGGEGGRG